MHIYCTSNTDYDGKILSITIGKYYQLTDTDSIGFRIIDNNGNNFWYIKDRFEPIHITRERKIKLINGKV